jgi:hypothetical protein
MNPFAAQQKAFALTNAGNVTAAAPMFIEALKGFRKLASDASLRPLLVKRAALIPGQHESAEAIVDQFLSKLPGWLRELHFDSFYMALTSYELKAARLHWSLLSTLSEQANPGSAMNLNLLREQVCQRRQVMPSALQEGTTESHDMLIRAEDILAIDSGNNTARRMAIAIYRRRLENDLERLTGRQDQSRAARVISKMGAGKRQRLHDSRKTVRRLRQHLRRAQSRADADVEEMVESYRQLAHYFLGVGELETTIKLTRRACRLRPQDDSLRVWARGVRRLRRRG